MWISVANLFDDVFYAVQMKDAVFEHYEKTSIWEHCIRYTLTKDLTVLEHNKRKYNTKNSSQGMNIILDTVSGSSPNEQLMQIIPFNIASS